MVSPSCRRGSGVRGCRGAHREFCPSAPKRSLHWPLVADRSAGRCHVRTRGLPQPSVRAARNAPDFEECGVEIVDPMGVLARSQQPEV
jgi:hypothetical protein